MNDIIKFDYNEDQLHAIVAEFSAIDRTDIALVKEKLKLLVSVRTSITGQGKKFRDDAIKFQKGVLLTENTYLAITATLENDFKSVIEEEKLKEIINARKALLPQKRDQINLLAYKPTISDDEIIFMTDEAWVAFYQVAMAHNQREIEMIVKAKEEQLNREENNRIQAENNKLKEEANRAEQLRKEKEQEANRAEQLRKEKEQEANKEIDKANKIAKEAQDKLELKNLEEEKEKERIADEATKQKEEQERLDSSEKHQKFLADNNFDIGSDLLVEKEGVVMIYRLLAKYKK